MLKKVIYGGISILFAIISYLLLYSFAGPVIKAQHSQIYGLVIYGCPVVFAVIGLIIAPFLVSWVEKITDKFLSFLVRMNLNDIISGVIGLIAGLFVASLLGSAFGQVRIIGPYLSILFSIFFGYIGLLVGYKKKEDFSRLFANMFKMDRSEKKDRISNKIPPKILDTSVIIDGRIADIYKTRFIEGELIIANFVLEELRHIADSSDQLKRNRGRRGLDIMNKLRQEFEGSIRITPKDYPDIAEVDSKLLKLAQDLKGVVITNDFNLNKVAQLQGVRVLNINELGNAVKPMLLPGEEMFAQVVKDGKESGQGIAYLDDGTMIVVENGRKYVNKNILVIVTSVLQTSAGRMIFARPKFNKNGDIIEESQVNLI